MLDTVQVQDCKNQQIEQSRAFARSYYMVIPKVFTERQKQRCDNSAITLTILFLLKTMDSLKNGLRSTPPHSGATPLFSRRTELLASLQSCRSVDADT